MKLKTSMKNNGVNENGGVERNEISVENIRERVDTGRNK